jgi:predicted nucleic acid-binding protein
VVAGALQNVDRVPADARDNPVVEAALEGGAVAIISDDNDLLSLKVIKVRGLRAIQIVAPGPYLKGSKFRD